MRVLDRSLSRLPKPLRTLVDWALTITLAAVAVLAFQAEVAKPYRIPREHVAWLAARLEDDPAGVRLHRALDNEVRILGLEVDDREAVGACLDATYGLGS